MCSIDHNKYWQANSANRFKSNLVIFLTPLTSFLLAEHGTLLLTLFTAITMLFKLFKYDYDLFVANFADRYWLHHSR